MEPHDLYRGKVLASLRLRTSLIPRNQQQRSVHDLLFVFPGGVGRNVNEISGCVRSGTSFWPSTNEPGRADVRRRTHREAVCPHRMPETHKGKGEIHNHGISNATPLPPKQLEGQVNTNARHHEDSQQNTAALLYVATTAHFNCVPTEQRSLLVRNSSTVARKAAVRNV